MVTQIAREWWSIRGTAGMCKSRKGSNNERCSLHHHLEMQMICAHWITRFLGPLVKMCVSRIPYGSSILSNSEGQTAQLLSKVRQVATNQVLTPAGNLSLVDPCLRVCTTSTRSRAQPGDRPRPRSGVRSAAPNMASSVESATPTLRIAGGAME
jgi:hypothetical protein